MNDRTCDLVATNDTENQISLILPMKCNSMLSAAPPAFAGLDLATFAMLRDTAGCRTWADQDSKSSLTFYLVRNTPALTASCHRRDGLAPPNPRVSPQGPQNSGVLLVCPWFSWVDERRGMQKTIASYMPKALCAKTSSFNKTTVAPRKSSYNLLRS